MNKEEILMKCREQKEDEGIIFSDNTGRRYGHIGLSIMFAAYMMLVIFMGGNFVIPMSFWCAFTGAECYGKYKTNCRKSELFGAVALSVSALVFLLSYLLIDLMKVIVY